MSSKLHDDYSPGSQNTQFPCMRSSCDCIGKKKDTCNQDSVSFIMGRKDIKGKLSGHTKIYNNEDTGSPNKSKRKQEKIKKGDFSDGSDYEYSGKRGNLVKKEKKMGYCYKTKSKKKTPDRSTSSRDSSRSIVQRGNISIGKEQQHHRRDASLIRTTDDDESDRSQRRAEKADYVESTSPYQRNGKHDSNYADSLEEMYIPKYRQTNNSPSLDNQRYNNADSVRNRDWYTAPPECNERNPPMDSFNQTTGSILCCNKPLIKVKQLIPPDEPTILAPPSKDSLRVDARLSSARVRRGKTEISRDSVLQRSKEVIQRTVEPTPSPPLLNSGPSRGSRDYTTGSYSKKSNIKMPSKENVFGKDIKRNQLYPQLDQERPHVDRRPKAETTQLDEESPRNDFRRKYPSSQLDAEKLRYEYRSKYSSSPLDVKLRDDCISKHPPLTNGEMLYSSTDYRVPSPPLGRSQEPFTLADVPPTPRERSKSLEQRPFEHKRRRFKDGERRDRRDMEPMYELNGQPDKITERPGPADPKMKLHNQYCDCCFCKNVGK